MWHNKERKNRNVGYLIMTETWQKRLIALIIACALFMEALDSTILNTAIPTMARSLHTDPIDLKIALISYLLSLAIFIPISGWIADKFGAKRVFITALLIFAVSSLWCGLVTNLQELIVARSLQGIGGSLMIPVGRLVLLRTYPRHEMINVMNIVVMVAAFGVMLGPVAGGFIVEYVAWSWIFWINVPIALLAIAAAKRWLPSSTPQKVPRLDKVGFVLFGSSLALFTFGLSALSESIFNNTLVTVVIGCAVVLFVAYVWHSHGRAHPIVNTKLFRQRTFKVSTVGNLLCRLGFGATPFLLPLMLQLSLDYTPQTSGLLLAPSALGILIGKPLSIYALRFLGYKRFLVFNTLATALALCSFVLVTPHTPLSVIAVLTFLFGSLTTLQYTGMNSLAYADVARETLGDATSIMGTLQQLAQSFGVAMGALLLHHFLSAMPAGTSLTISIFHHTFLVLGLLTALSATVFTQLKAEDGQQMLVRGEP
jgi:EmrB/QacA subfamily drug resistance transporter